jgi:hypothetical protein
LGGAPVTVTARATDDNGATGTETKPGSIANTSPVAQDDTATTSADTAVDINVLLNDSDSDGVLDPTTVTVTSGPTNGTVSVDPTTGQVTYTPATAWTGTDTFTYTVQDNAGAVSNAATVAVTVS